MLRRTTLRTLAATAAVLLTATACSGEGDTADPTASASETSTEPADPDALPDYDIDSVVPLGTLFKVFALDDLMITFGGGPVIGLDTPAISERYALEPVAGNNTDVALSDDKSVAYTLSVATEGGEGTATGTDEITVTEFDPETGETGEDAIFKRTRTSGDQPGQPLLANIKGIAGDRVVVDTRTDDLGVHAVSVLDLRTGRSAWSRSDELVVAVTDESVITYSTARDVPEVVSYDVATGDRQWRALAGASDVHEVGLTDDAVVLTWTADAATAPAPKVGRLLLEDGAIDGRVRSTTSSAWTCFDGTDEVAVCQVGGGLTGWQLETNKVAWALPTEDRYAPELRQVTDGKIIGTLAESWVVLDAASGEDLASGTGSAPSVANEIGGVFFENGEAVWIPVVGAEQPEEASPTIVP